ncbi:MAG TPA: CHAT domain-containing protein [Luteibaculaceae bacterium]|nr:CHAT domain-containing protein [Luteibaculaceae bacterium]
MSISRLLIFLAILTWVQPSEAISRDRYGSLHKKALKKGNYAKCLRKAERRFKRDSTLTGLIYLNRLSWLGGFVAKQNRYSLLLEDRLAAGGDSLSELQREALYHALFETERYGLAFQWLPDSLSLDWQIKRHGLAVKLGELEWATQWEADWRQAYAAADTSKNTTRKDRKAWARCAIALDQQAAEGLYMQGLYDSLATQSKRLQKRGRRSADFDRKLNLAYVLAGAHQELGQYDEAQRICRTTLSKSKRKRSFHHPQMVMLIDKLLDNYHLDKEFGNLLKQKTYYFDKLRYFDRQRRSSGLMPLLVGEYERDCRDGFDRAARKKSADIMEWLLHYDSLYSPIVDGVASRVFWQLIEQDEHAQASTLVAGINRRAHQKWGKQHPAYWRTIMETAAFQTYHFSDREALAFPEQNEAWKAFQSNYQLKSRTYFYILNGIGTSMQLNNRLQDQVSWLQSSIAECEQLMGKKTDWARQQLVLADAYLYQGEYQKAQQLITETQPVLEQLESRKGFYSATANRIEAEVFQNTGKLKEAETRFKRASKDVARADYHIDHAVFNRSDQWIAMLLARGEISRAERLVDRILANNTSSRPSDLIVPYLQKTECLFAKGNLLEAQQWGERAWKAAVSSQQERTLVGMRVSRLVADIDLSLGDYQSAATRYQELHQAQVKLLGSKNSIAASTEIKRCLAHFLAYGEAQKQLTLLREQCMLIKAEQGDQSSAYADALLAQATLEIAAQEPRAAIESLSLAKTIVQNETGRKGLAWAKITSEEGDSWLMLDSTQKAIDAYEEALEWVNRRGGQSHPLYTQVQSKLAGALIHTQQFDRAEKLTAQLVKKHVAFVEEVLPYLTEKEKAGYWQRMQIDFDRSVGFMLQHPDDSKRASAVLQMRGAVKQAILRNAVEFAKEIRSSTDTALGITFSEWLALKRFYASSVGLSAEELREKGVDLNSLALEINDLEKILKNALGAEKKKMDRSEKSFWRNLKDHESLVEIVRHRDLIHPSSFHYSAIVVQGTSKKPTVIDLGSAPEMEREGYKYYRNAIKLDANDLYSYTLFWEGIDTLVRQSAQVYFSPDGVYGLMNPELFRGDSLMIDQYQLITINNPADFRPTGEKGKVPSRAEMFGNPSFYSDQRSSKRVSDLPATEAEIQNVSQLLTKSGVESSVRLKNEATEDLVKQSASPGILHLATHGYFEDESDAAFNAVAAELTVGPNPLLQSGLLMSDGGPLFDPGANKYATNGLLTALEVQDLNLSGTDLVVLSACETGLGAITSGNGVLGLQYAFQDAGAKAVLMTLFKVDDQLTAEFMSLFYEKWLLRGDKQLAIYEAKREFKVVHPEPRIWGSFVLVGH